MARSVLVLGGSGALGRAVMATFQSQSAWRAISMDVVTNEDAEHEVLLPARITQADVEPTMQRLDQLMDASKLPQLSSVLCVAGGWAGGAADAADVVDSADRMLMSSVMVRLQPCLPTSMFASK